MKSSIPVVIGTIFFFAFYAFTKVIHCKKLLLISKLSGQQNKLYCVHIHVYSKKVC